jgi:DMSO/TMAO reductase YedYZ heme-binding membrane subunit
MKTYFAFIHNTQEFLLAISVILLATLPATLVLRPEWFSDVTYFWLYAVAHFTLFLVMLVRPLADIFRGVKWIRPLVILRKGFGVLSASIIVSFLLAKIIADASGYFASIATPEYWSLHNLALFAHLADISAVILLVTSNTLSKQLLGKNWKRIQKLSYVYFYASAFYVFFILGEALVMIYVVIVTIFTVLAWLRNHGYMIQTSKPNLTTA